MMLLQSVRDGVVFVEGTSYFGTTEEVTLPEIQYRMLERKPTGGLGTIELQNGLDKMEAEIKFLAYDRRLASRIITPKKPVSMMIRSLYQNHDGSGGVVSELALVTYLGGVTKSFGLGSHKGGETAEFPWKGAIHYLKQTLDGQTLLEIDVINQIYRAGDEDLLATIRRILGI